MTGGIGPKPPSKSHELHSSVEVQKCVASPDPYERTRISVFEGQIQYQFPTRSRAPPRRPSSVGGTLLGALWKKFARVPSVSSDRVFHEKAACPCASSANALAPLACVHLAQSR